MSLLLDADVAADAGRTRGRQGANRRVQRLPGDLVRPFREPAAVARRHAAVVPDDRIVIGTTRAAAARGAVDLPAVRDSPRTHERSPAEHAVPLLALRSQSRQADYVLRFPAREGFHPSAFACAARSAPAERSDDQLLELWRADRSRAGI